MCKNQSLLASPAFGCQQLSRAAESLPVSAHRGSLSRPHSALHTDSLSPAPFPLQAQLPLSSLPPALPKEPGMTPGSWPCPLAAWAATCMGKAMPRSPGPAVSVRHAPPSQAHSPATARAHGPSAASGGLGQHPQLSGGPAVLPGHASSPGWVSWVQLNLLLPYQLHHGSAGWSKVPRGLELRVDHEGVLALGAVSRC